MTTTANDHDNPTALGHDFPSPPCPGGCGWPEVLCHC